VACVRAAGPGSFCASSRAGCLEPDSPPGGSGARAAWHPTASPSPDGSPPCASERCAACRTGAGADPDGCCSGAASPAHSIAPRKPVSAPRPRTPLNLTGADRAAAQAPAASPAWPQAADAPVAGQVRCARGPKSRETVPRGCPVAGSRQLPQSWRTKAGNACAQLHWWCAHTREVTPRSTAGVLRGVAGPSNTVLTLAVTRHAC